MSDTDFELVKGFQQEWGLPNQQAVVSQLIESHQQKLSVAKELLEAKAQIAQMEKHIKQLQDKNNQLEQENKEMESATPQQVIINASDLESYLETMIEQKLQQALAKLPQPRTPEPAVIPMPTPVVQPKVRAVPPKEVINWEFKSNAELWETKASGAATEKIRRSFEAICLYNNIVATGDNDRLAITNLALRELSGVNGLSVGDWIKAHSDEIISHNAKHGMQNSKNPSKVETYYNKRHGQDKILGVLKLVNERFLEGVALKSQQAA